MKTKSFPYTLDVDSIPTTKIVDITPEPGSESRVRYACLGDDWDEHLKAWRREMRNGNRTAPEPMPAGHLMFETPESYGCVRYGDNSPENKRKAIESHVRGMLSGGWTRGLTPEQESAIVNATVEAQMAGVDTGAAPFVACVGAWIENGN